MSTQHKRRLYPGDVHIVEMPSNRCYALVTDHSGQRPAAYVGPWRTCKADAIRDAASWLEDRGYVHATTHNIEG